MQTLAAASEDDAVAADDDVDDATPAVDSASCSIHFVVLKYSGTVSSRRAMIL
jgi:hypothetical protein